MKKRKEKTNNQNRSKHSKAGLIAFIENNFKYILAAIAVIIAIIAVFFGESKLIYQQEPVTAHVKFSVINYEITPEVEQGQTPVVEYAYTLAQAVNKAPAGKSTIKVLVGVEETSEVTIPAGTDIVLDLNGKTVTFNIDAQSADTSAIVNNGVLRITDSTQAVNEYNYTMQDGTKPAFGGTLTSNKVALTNNGTGTIDGTAHVQGTGSAINTIINDGDLTIDSGLVTSTQNNATTIQNGDSNIESANLTINGGTFISANECLKNAGSLDQESAQTVTAQAVKITGGKFEAECNVIDNKNDSTGLIYITGGDIKGGLRNNAQTPTVYNGGNGKIIIDEVNPGDVLITDYSINCAIYNGYVSGATGTVEIRKGTITAINSTGIRNRQGATLIIGTDEVAAGGTTSVNTTNPTITGNTYGISKESGTFYFYDGSVVGKNGAGSSCNKEPDSIPQDCETQVKLNGTIETLTLNRYAIFDTGENVNIKMKKLVDSSVTARTAADSSIKSIQYYTGTMDDNNKTADNKVSSQDSKADIYMWYDNTNNEGIIYWWSEDPNPKLNVDASYMFYRLNALTDISGVSGFDTSSTTSMYCLFAKSDTAATVSPTNVDALANWDISNVENLRAMFQRWVNLQNINGLSNWDTDEVLTMYNMFSGCLALTNISGATNWDTGKVTTTNATFQYCQALTDISALSNWDTSSMTETRNMFYGCTNLTTIDISGWDTSSVTNMQNMFYGCTNLTTIDISGWDTSSVTVMKAMFECCPNLETIYVEDGWSTAGVTTAANGADMFSGASKLVGGAGTACDGTNNITYTYACIDQGPSSASPGYLTGTTALLTYNANGHGTAPANVTMTKTSATNAEDVYTAEGYLLTGWNTKADGSGTAYAPGAVVKAANTLPSYMTLYAQWVHVVDITENAPVPRTNNGLTYVGVSSSYGLTSNNYSTVSYGILYNNNGTINDVSMLKVENIDDVNVLHKANKSGTNLQDLGYGVTAVLYIVVSDQNNNEYTFYSGNLGGNFADLAQATLTYNANGHGTAPANVTMTFDNATNAAAALTETGYTFTGWNTAADGSGTAYAAGAEVKAVNVIPDAVTLYAQWIPETSTITINKNNAAWSGSGMKIDLSTNNSSNTATFTQTVSSGSEAVFENLVSGTTYYIYAGKHSSAKTTMVNTGLTIVAGESKTVDYYTITGSQGTGTTLTTRFDSSSGSSLSSGTNVLKGVTIYAKATINSGYHGTVTLKHGNTSMTASGGTFTVSTNETITSGGATGNSYTIVFNKNASEASGTMSNLAMTYGTAKNLTAKAFTRSGYVFKEWNTEANGSGTSYSDGQSVNNLTTTNNGTVNLYAQWTPVTYSIKFNANGGSGTMSNLSMTYGTAKNLTANAFTRTDYVFLGWATSSTGNMVYTNKQSVNNLTTTNGETVNLYAVWAGIGDSVNYNPGTATTASISLPNGAKLARTISASSASNWEVLGATSSGDILIIPKTYSTTKLTLAGMDGYNNAIEVLNNVAEIYLNPTYATSARSITVEDVNKRENYTPSGSTSSYKWNHRYGMDSNLNITDTGSDSNTPKQTYTRTTETGNYSYNTNYFRGMSCWLASRCVFLSSFSCNFEVRYLDGSNVSNNDLFVVYSSGNASGSSRTCPVVPVVTLKSTVKMDKDSNGVWQLSL